MPITKLESPKVSPEQIENLSSMKMLLEDYLELPELPFGETVNVMRINHFFPFPVPYKYLTELDSTKFPEGKVPDEDYMEDDFVYPMSMTLKVKGETKQYQTPMLLWFPLDDVTKAIVQKQSKTLRKILPVKIKLNEKRFMVDLMNLAPYELKDIIKNR